MPDEPVNLLRGALDALILKALTWRPTHGYGVARWIESVTDDALRIEEGSLYPALYRLERRRWIDSEWGVSDNNRKAKYYRITARGRAQLRAEAANFTRFAEAVFKALQAAPDVA
jgi:PadR family transcriptional regulator, regulatory protein PadR